MSPTHSVVRATPSHISAQRSKAVLLWALAIACSGGCQRYSAQPLNVSARLDEYLARTPTDITSPVTPATTGDPAVSSPLTLRDVQALALIYNPQLRTARARANITLASAANAGLWDDPELALDVARVLDVTQNPWKIGGALSLTLPVSGRLSAQRALAGSEHTVELEKIVQQEWAVRNDTARALQSVGAATALESEIVSYLQAVDSVLELVTKMEAAGELPRAELRLFSIERALQQLALATARAQRASADLELKRIIGLPPSVTLTFDPASLWPSDRASFAIPPQTPPDELAQHSLPMRIAAAEYQAAEKALALEIRKQYPDVTIGPGAAREDGNDELRLGVSLPLPLLNRNHAAIARATAQRELAAALTQETLEKTLIAYQSAANRVATANAQLELIETTLVPIVQAQVQDTRAVAALGEVSTFVLLESLKRRHEAMITLIDTRLLALHAGRDLLEIVGPEPTAPIQNLPTPSSAAPSSPTSPAASQD